VIRVLQKTNSGELIVALKAFGTAGGTGSCGMRLKAAMRRAKY
jgi:hypothetical protein